MAKQQLISRLDPQARRWRYLSELPDAVTNGVLTLRPMEEFGHAFNDGFNEQSCLHPVIKVYFYCVDTDSQG